MSYNLLQMVRRTGSRRRRWRFRTITVRPAHVRALEAIYRDILMPWVLNEDAIVKAYSQTVAEGVADSSDDIERLLDLIQIETNRALVRLTARIKDWARGMERFHREAWKDGVLAATGINLDTILTEHAVGETVAATVARNVELIKNIDSQARGRIGDIVFRGVSTRLPVRQIAKEISEAVDMGRTRARTIAADQASKLLSALDQARQEEAGIDHFIWRHSGKVHYRVHHKERNGRLYKWRKNGPAPGADPPQANDMPGRPPWCGCKAQAALIDERGRVI